MKTRHRIPTIFNLSMVDVLCCALGCVILLWLLNLREAKQRMAEAGEADRLLGQTRALLADTDRDLKGTRGLLARTQGDRDKLAGDLKAARSRVADLDRSLTALRAEQAATAERLAKKTKDEQNRSKDLAAARERLADLDLLVRAKDAKIKAAARSADDLAERLRDADARAMQLRSRADQVAGLRDKLAAAEARAKSLEQDVAARGKDLAGATRMIESLQDEKKSLADQVVRAKVAAENRFAGITLTGRRVVFLVDMSGSMELVDENTPAPAKWAEVRQALGRIMRSLTDLEKFQVILFADRVTFPLGSEGQWLDYDAVTSTGRVAQALAATKPQGGTNMYAAFDAAFRYRAMGLDAVYVFSDGLPNIGPGLGADAGQNLNEQQRSEILSKYIRRQLLRDWNPKEGGRPRVRLNAIGFFYESPDVGAFLWALTRENEGSFVGMSRP